MISQVKKTHHETRRHFPKSTDAQKPSQIKGIPASTFPSKTGMQRARQLSNYIGALRARPTSQNLLQTQELANLMT